jgi:Restriction endonuclease fold toxin 7
VRGTYNVEGRQRILDNVIKARNEIYESKNVAYQALTRQLRDFIDQSKAMGAKAYLTVRDTTQLAKTVQEQIKQGNLIGLSFIRDELQNALITLKNKKP